MNNPQHKTLGCYVALDMYNQVMSIAKEYDIPVSTLIKNIIKNFLEEPNETYFFRTV